MLIYVKGVESKAPEVSSWAFVVLSDDQEVDSSSGAASGATINQIVMHAAIDALQYARKNIKGCDVKIRSDSDYLTAGMAKRLDEWKSNGWRTNARKPVKNKGLWLKLEELCGSREVAWKWVGRAEGNKWMQRAEELARAFSTHTSSSAAVNTS